MMLRSAALSLAGLMAVAAAPQSGFVTTPLVPPIVSVKPQVLATPSTPPGFAPAPLPDRDAMAPHTRASSEASVSPSIFTRRDQYRGEALNANSSAQIEQERRVSPGAGFNLLMPLQ